VLLGSAIFTSMNGATRLATPGVFARWDPYGARAGGTNTNRKSDQIALGRGVDEQRHIFRVSTTTRSGNREIVRTRPVTRIAANLATGNLGVDIPAFNPLAMFADNDAPEADMTAEALPATDGDMSYTVKNLGDVALKPDDGPTVPLDQVL